MSRPILLVKILWVQEGAPVPEDANCVLKSLVHSGTLCDWVPLFLWFYCTQIADNFFRFFKRDADPTLILGLLLAHN
jgi:hypothetical protein